MSKGKRHRDTQHAEHNGTDTVPETADAIDEVISAAQDRTEQPAAAMDAPAPEQNGNGHAPGEILNPTSTRREGHDAETNGQPEAKAAWIRRFGHMRDSEAGVRIEEDRRNHLSTIYFREAPPLAALDLLLDRGWVKDAEMGGYSKPHSKLRPAESREQNDTTLHEVRNIVRVSKGLEPKDGEFVPGVAR